MNYKPWLISGILLLVLTTAYIIINDMTIAMSGREVSDITKGLKDIEIAISLIASATFITIGFSLALKKGEK